MSFPSRAPRPFGRRRPLGPTLDEVMDQLDRSLEALRRANDGLQRLATLSSSSFSYAQTKQR